MQLICNGVRLDLKEGADMSFKKSNILFAFDDASCERSQSFDIPATAHNEQVFALAKEPAFSGEGMRRRFDAQLQMGIVVKNGYLYVDSFAKGYYKAVFVTGELVGLQAIKNVGKIGDIWEQQDYVEWKESNVVPAPTTSRWGLIDYQRTEGLISPSFNVKKVTEVLFELIGKRITLPSGMDYLRIVTGEKKGYSKREVLFSRKARSLEQGYSANTPVCMYFDTTNYSHIFKESTLAVTIALRDRYIDTESDIDRDIYYYGKIKQIECTQDLKITFPDEGISDDLLVASFDGSVEVGTTTGRRDNYYGDCYIASGNEKVGTLRRKTITIPANTPFIIFSKDEYITEVESGAIYKQRLGWQPKSFSVRLTVEGSAVERSRLELKDNLPDYTLVDLLKIIAAYSGKVLNYTEADGIIFDELDYKTWAIRDYTSSLIQIDKVSRTFGDYGQSNIIEFDSDDSVASAEFLRVDYTIDNDNLAAENTLQTIPLSEGSSGGIVNDSEVLWDKSEDGASMLADCATGVTKLTRVSLTKNSNLQALCDKSTSIQATLLLPIYEWEQITPKTIIQIKGVRYVWTSGTWKNGKAQLELSAIL